MRRFGFSIDIPKNICYFQNKDNIKIHKVNSNKTWLKMTPCQKYSCSEKPVVVVLQVCEPNNGLHYMYKRIRLYNCTCYLQTKKLGNECTKQKTEDYIIKQHLRRHTLPNSTPPISLL